MFKNWIRKHAAPLLLIIPLGIYLFFGLQHLTQFETADEHYWMYSNTNNNNYWVANNGRIQQYWSALAKGDWKKTRINDKPGITLAYVSGVGAWFKTQLEQDIVTGKQPALTKMDKALHVNWYFRLPLLLFNGFFIFMLFFLVRKLTSSGLVAFITSSFLYTSSIVIGISQIVNPDALLWEFTFAATLSFLIYLEYQQRRYAVFAALFLGLSLLTKYSSVILLPFFLLVMIMHVFRGNNVRALRRYALAYIGIVAGGLALYAVLMPDNLIEFRHFLKGSVGFKGMQYFFALIFFIDVLLLVDAYFGAKVMIFIREHITNRMVYTARRVFYGLLLVAFAVVVLNTISGNDLLGLFTVPFDAAEKHFFSDRAAAWEIGLRQLLPLVFSLPPIILLLVFIRWTQGFWHAKKQWIVDILSLFLVVFIVAVTGQQVPLTIRYSIMLYPILFTIAAIGLAEILSHVRIRTRVVVLCVAILGNVVGIVGAMPFYFNYTSSLLPKQYVITDAWGYGGYEAAALLNSKPAATQSRVWSDYNGFCVFYNGDCAANHLTMKNILSSAKKEGKTPQFSYFVSQRRGRSLSVNVWETIETKYVSEKIWRLEINERPQNFIEVYKNN